MLLLLLTVATLSGIPSHARATQHKAAPFEGYSKFVRYDINFHVNANYSHVETDSWALKVLAPQGVSDANQASITYSDRLETAKILYAYTLKKDGHRINVPASNFQENVNKGKGKARPMFSDIKTITVAFPDVAVGDTVVLSYKLIQKKPTIPGNFSFIETFSKFFDYDNARVTMSAPASLRMQVESRSVKGGEIASKDGRKRWLWTYQNRHIATPEPGSVSALDYGPMIVASTFKNYGAVAAGYAARARAKAKPDAAIIKLADRITRKAHTERAQAAALYYWVSKNITYAGDYVGVGAVVPHAASLILKNRMGDCKDHTTLLRAMLAAKGIRATSALIHSGNAFTLPEVPTIDIFNHVITYIPSLHLYADSTSRFTPFGKLPMSDADKPVILTTGYNGIQHTPPTNWKDNGTVTRAVLTIKPDGSASGETKFTMQGIFSNQTRAILTYLPPNLEQELVRRSLVKSGYTGTGTLNLGDPSKPTDIYHYSESFKVTDAMNVPGPGAFTIKEIGGGNLIAKSVSASANAPKRTVDFACMGGYMKQFYTLHMPHNVKILAIPSDVHLKGWHATYSATYKRTGNTITVARVLDDMTPGNVCTPKDSAAFKPFAIRVMKDLHSQILYK